MLLLLEILDTKVAMFMVEHKLKETERKKKLRIAMTSLWEAARKALTSKAI